jgi:hypothetical protein
LTGTLGWLAVAALRFAGPAFAAGTEILRIAIENKNSRILISLLFSFSGTTNPTK